MQAVNTPFQDINLAYVLELYERYQTNPGAFDPATQAFFNHWSPPALDSDGHALSNGYAAAPQFPLEKIVGAVNYAQAVRGYGDMIGNLNPLGFAPKGDPSLNMAAHRINEADLQALPASLIGGPIAQHAANALDAINQLKALYCNTLGYDFEHLADRDERAWFSEVIEGGHFRTPKMPVDAADVLYQLSRVEAFEVFLNRVYPGKHRFSIEGVDMLVPILNEMIHLCGAGGVQQVFIGMAHRGRLNVLAHVMRVQYSSFIAQFNDTLEMTQKWLQEGYLSDVKYHDGAHLDKKTRDGHIVSVTLAPNPSHLEAVNPVVEGMARAAATQMQQRGPGHLNAGVSLPILIHGDAAFPGQGIVAETLNMCKLEGYKTGGTIHIITNNQVGFTTDSKDARSTVYASDLARGFQIPIVHVNADDPLACIEAARIAHAYRSQFKNDIVIDLIGYRRYGHNEADDPTLTQPEMYQRVKEMPRVRERFAQNLIAQNAATQADIDQLMLDAKANLDAAKELFHREEEPKPSLEKPPAGAARMAETAVPLQRLRELSEGLFNFPAGFAIQERLRKVILERRAAFDTPSEPALDWAAAEELAFASILADGHPIRLTGQDVQRGTFSHRHAVLHDQETFTPHSPLQHLPQAQASFDIANSPLTENGAIGFEYGFNIQAPNALVVWEAQYGDFINGAQTTIDEFVTSARDKWGQKPSLVLLLPHGYEGAGPDHSTGRLERFLQMAADMNMRIVNCTTAAQYFHMLRRQALLLQTDPLPLIVMSPKSLLRDKMIKSSVEDLTRGKFQLIIDDARARQTPDKITRLVLCSGKLAIDLLKSPHREADTKTALVRLEQLYPLKPEDLDALVKSYPKVKELAWAQEEPQNAGAWDFIYPYLIDVADNNKLKRPVYYGRPRLSSPSEGLSSMHKHTQEKLMNSVYGK
jgi:2-oxoglutarate dehydrogenase E1 component